MAWLFVSYRRQDSSPFTERISDRLRDAFGAESVFKDVGSIMPGAKWRDELDRKLDECRMVVVVIGARWAGIRDADGRPRLADPRDFVHRELTTAMDRGKHLLPLLVDGAELPALDNVPVPLRGVLDYQMWPVRRDPDFATDMDRVVQAIARTLGVPARGAPGSRLVVPRSLRAFGSEDADVFLDLVPGPRDSDGLPESISFWTTWMARARRGEARPVGLLYGPSGGGKTSLVRAGLLPRLDRSILPVYVEAKAEKSGAALAQAVARAVAIGPEAATADDPETTLRAAAAAATSASRTLLVVIDQLEQWLHTLSPADGAPDLARALRHCDGRSAMALVLVRDDYAMEAGRRLRVGIDFEDNCARLEPFGRGHARSVLEAFGRGYGRWPAPPARLPEGADAFLGQVVDELAEDADGRIVAVRIALFAEMIKDRPWTLATLDAVGGARGVGVAFLEQKFADPLRRGHRRGAEAVLRALLPEAGLAVKGRMRPRAELLDQSGLAGHPDEFDELLRILDDDLRLITPTHPEAAEPGPAPGEGDRYYQLTHDYLVEPIRAWIARDEMRTWRGRIAARLRETTDAWWAYRRDPRFLPGLRELASYPLAGQRPRTEAQKLMIRAAWRRQRGRLAMAAAIAVALAIPIGLGIRAVVRESRASTLIHQYLVASDSSAAAGFVPRMASYRDRIVAEFRRQLAGGPLDPTWAEQQGPRIVAALIRLHDAEGAGAALRQDADPVVRTTAIHELAKLGVDGQELLDRLGHEPDAGVRRALTLALGQYKRESFPDRERLATSLCRRFEDDPDPGVQSAAEWARRALGLAGPCGPRGARAHSGRPIVTAEGQTLVVLEQGVPRRFAIATTEVTQDEFERFVRDIAGRSGKGEITWSKTERFDGRAPATNLNWFHAMAYCVWLTERDRLGPAPHRVDAPRVVDAIRSILEADPASGKSVLPADVLDDEGYRLPTVDEWEFCCRGGETVPFRYLREYENYTYGDRPNEQRRPVGSLKPNELGLFDVRGNVFEWSLDWRPNENKSPFPTSSTRPPAENPLFLGGSHYTLEEGLACGVKSQHDSGPSQRYPDVGFRVAKTMPRGDRESPTHP